MSGLQFSPDPGPRSAPLQMALDEVMMRKSQHPFLRQYQWSRPSVSIGYFTPSAELEPYVATCEVVRRYTGGGLVDHRGDWTFSLTVPSTILADAGLATRDWYCRIHCAVRDALSNSGVYLQPSRAISTQGPCFQAPVEFDGMLNGRKIFGGAIRRSRQGLLYQGSLQGMQPPGDLLVSIGEKLELGPLMVRHPEEDILLEAAYLGSVRYATTEWLRKF